MDVKKIYLSWLDIEQLTINVIEQIEKDHWTPTIVVGITRGGLIPATLISHYFKIPMVSLDVSFRDNTLIGPESHYIPEETKNGHQILVADDINDSGQTMSWIKNDWESTLKSIDPILINNVRFAALVHNKSSSFFIDYEGMMIDKNKDPQWICYPWENWSNERK